MSKQPTNPFHPGEILLEEFLAPPTIEVRRYRDLRRDPLEILNGSVSEYTGPTEPVGEGDWEAPA